MKKFITIKNSEKALVELLTDLEERRFFVCNTRNGALAVIFTQRAGGEKPLMGAYYSGDQWVAAHWLESGAYVDDDTPRALDLDLPRT